ncbi:MAG: transcription/translation regulatory transformer protein RfaH [Pseudomonadota bacterium]|nr:transcription/translation regulatory transformer protein RfaH [Pseudomonadota bacterium]
MNRWYAIQTKPRKERFALENLERQGYRCYLPMARERRRLRGRYRWTDSALFPRYLFAQLDLAQQNVAPIRSTLGVIGLVRFGHQLPALPDRLIADIQAREDSQTGCIEVSPPDWAPGATVAVMEGPFRGIEGIFKARTGEERVIVLLKLLGSERAIELPEQLITAC